MLLQSHQSLNYKRHATGKTKKREIQKRRWWKRKRKEGGKLRKRNTETVNHKTGSR